MPNGVRFVLEEGGGRTLGCVDNAAGAPEGGKSLQADLPLVAGVISSTHQLDACLFLLSHPTLHTRARLGLRMKLINCTPRWYSQRRSGHARLERGVLPFLHGFTCPPTLIILVL